MKKQAFRIFTTLSFIGLLAVASVQAQSDGKLVADIPFTFTVGEATLPAGEYIVNRTRAGHLLIQRADGQASATAITMRVQASATPDEGKLVFHRYGDQYFLCQVWTPAEKAGRELLKSRLERELAKSAAERQVVSLKAQRP